MRQHPDPDGYQDKEEDLEELGTPVYEGSGLSVRALTAEELQQFLDAHQDQPAQRLGSGWPPSIQPTTGSGIPGPLQGLSLSPPNPSRPSPTSKADIASAALAARPSSSTGAAARPSWPPGLAAWPGERPWWPSPV